MHPQAHKLLDNSAVRLALAVSAAVLLRYAVFPAAESPFLRFSSVLQPVHSVDWFETSSATCAGYFGNGFTEGLDLVGGSLACRTNPATRSFFCRVKNLLLNPSDIKMTRGDEKLEDVMGRSESDELPAFGPRAARIVVAASASSNWTRVLPRQGLPPAFATLSSKDAFKFKLLEALRTVPAPSLAVAGCKTVVSAPVLLLTRMEYVNLFHTSTDWFNAWQVSRILGFAPSTAYAADALRGLTPEMRAREAAAPRSTTSPRLPIHVVFVDGHNAGPMDDGWLALFLSINYIKHLPDGVCFGDAILAPFGYHAPLIAGIETRGGDCPSEPHVRQFSDDFVAALGLRPRAAATAACEESPPPLVFVRRTHYVVHPRHGGQVVRRLENEEAVLAALLSREAAAGVRVVEGDFARMTLRAQVEAVQGACAIFGAHGAGLSHILFAPPGTRVLELRPPGFVRPHFVAYARWAGALHTDWLGSSKPPPGEAVARILALVAREGGTKKEEGPAP